MQNMSHKMQITHERSEYDFDYKLHEVYATKEFITVRRWQLCL